LTLPLYAFGDLVKYTTKDGVLTSLQANGESVLLHTQFVADANSPGDEKTTQKSSELDLMLAVKQVKGWSLRKQLVDGVEKLVYTYGEDNDGAATIEGAIKSGDWNHVYVSYNTDRMSGQKVAELWINGELAGAVDDTPVVDAEGKVAVAPKGFDLNLVPVAVGYGYEGLLDELVVHSEPLGDPGDELPARLLSRYVNPKSASEATFFSRGTAKAGNQQGDANRLTDWVWDTPQTFTYSNYIPATTPGYYREGAVDLVSAGNFTELRGDGKEDLRLTLLLNALPYGAEITGIHVKTSDGALYGVGEGLSRGLDGTALAAGVQPSGLVGVVADGRLLNSKGSGETLELSVMTPELNLDLYLPAAKALQGQTHQVQVFYKSPDDLQQGTQSRLWGVDSKGALRPGVLTGLSSRSGSTGNGNGMLLPSNPAALVAGGVVVPHQAVASSLKEINTGFGVTLATAADGYSLDPVSGKESNASFAEQIVLTSLKDGSNVVSLAAIGSGTFKPDASHQGVIWVVDVTLSGADGRAAAATLSGLGSLAANAPSALDAAKLKGVEIVGKPGLELGESLVWADLDRDGKPELVIGNPAANDGAGEVVIIRGAHLWSKAQLSGAARRIDLSKEDYSKNGENVRVLKGAPGSRFGAALSAANFVEVATASDSKVDLAIGAPEDVATITKDRMGNDLATPLQNKSAGAVYLLRGGTDLFTASTPREAVQIADGALPQVKNYNYLGSDSDKSRQFGASLAAAAGGSVSGGAKDFDEDGIADLVIGIPGLQTDLVIIKGPELSGGGQIAISPNADAQQAKTYTETLRISTPSSSQPDDQELVIEQFGGALVVRGGSHLAAAGGATANGNNSVLLRGDTFLGNAAAAGTAVASGGDYDGDKVVDLAIGLPDDDNFTGAVSVLSGKTIGEWLKKISGRPTYYSAVHDAALYIQGIEDQGKFGSSVSFASDVDGDGRSELLLGSPAFYEKTGMASVLFGQKDFGSENLALDAVGDLKFYNLRQSDPNRRVDLYPGNAYVGLGLGMAAADLNGDSKSELVLSTSTLGSELSVLWGGEKLKAAVSLGLKDYSSGVGVDYGVEREWYDAASTAAARAIEVGLVGDINGDGLSDQVLRVIDSDKLSDFALEVGYGLAGGLAPSHSDAGTGGNSVLRLYPKMAVALGEGAQNLSWRSVSGIGDLDRDGVEDLLLGYSYAPAGEEISDTVNGLAILRGGLNLSNDLLLRDQPLELVDLSKAGSGLQTTFTPFTAIGVAPLRSELGNPTLLLRNGGSAGVVAPRALDVDLSQLVKDWFALLGEPTAEEKEAVEAVRDALAAAVAQVESERDATRTTDDLLAVAGYLEGVVPGAGQAFRQYVFNRYPTSEYLPLQFEITPEGSSKRAANLDGAELWLSDVDGDGWQELLLQEKDASAVYSIELMGDEAAGFGNEGAWQGQAVTEGGGGHGGLWWSGAGGMNTPANLLSGSSNAASVKAIKGPQVVFTGDYYVPSSSSFVEQGSNSSYYAMNGAYLDRSMLHLSGVNQANSAGAYSQKLGDGSLSSYLSGGAAWELKIPAYVWKRSGETAWEDGADQALFAISTGQPQASPDRSENASKLGGQGFALNIDEYQQKLRVYWNGAQVWESPQAAGDDANVLDVRGGLHNNEAVDNVSDEEYKDYSGYWFRELMSSAAYVRYQPGEYQKDGKSYAGKLLLSFANSSLYTAWEDGAWDNIARPNAVNEGLQVVVDLEKPLSLGSGDLYLTASAASGGSKGIHALAGIEFNTDKPLEGLGLRGLQAAGDLNGDGYADFVGVGSLAAGWNYDYTLDLVHNNLSRLPGADDGWVSGVNDDEEMKASYYSGNSANGQGITRTLLQTPTIVWGSAKPLDLSSLMPIVRGSSTASYRQNSDVSKSDVLKSFENFSSEENLTIQPLGDFNGDGFDDLAIGDRGTGDVYVLFGGLNLDQATAKLDRLSAFFAETRAKGQITTGTTDRQIDSYLAVDANGFGAAVIDGISLEDALVSIDGSSGTSAGGADYKTPSFGGVSAIKIEGLDPASYTSGVRLSAGGDFNGDGRPDLQISSVPKADGDVIRTVIFSSDPTLSVNLIGTPGLDSLKGTPAGEVIHGREGGDIVQGFGGMDVILAGPGDDTVHLVDDRFRQVDGGTGFDVLVLEGEKDQRWDLTRLASGGRVRNVEFLDLSDFGNNEVVLNAAAVAAMAGSSGTIQIEGDVQQREPLEPLVLRLAELARDEGLDGRLRASLRDLGLRVALFAESGSDLTVVSDLLAEQGKDVIFDLLRRIDGAAAQRPIDALLERLDALDPRPEGAAADAEGSMNLAGSFNGYVAGRALTHASALVELADWVEQLEVDYLAAVEEVEGRADAAVTAVFTRIKEELPTQWREAFAAELSAETSRSVAFEQVLNRGEGPVYGQLVGWLSAKSPELWSASVGPSAAIKDLVELTLLQQQQSAVVPLVQTLLNEQLAAGDAVRLSREFYLNQADVDVDGIVFNIYSNVSDTLRVVASSNVSVLVDEAVSTELAVTTPLATSLVEDVTAEPGSAEQLRALAGQQSREDLVISQQPLQWDAATQTLKLTLLRSGYVSGDVAVAYTIVRADGALMPPLAGTVVFPAGATTKTLTLQLPASLAGVSNLASALRVQLEPLAADAVSAAGSSAFVLAAAEQSNAVSAVAVAEGEWQSDRNAALFAAAQAPQLEEGLALLSADVSGAADAVVTLQLRDQAVNGSAQASSNDLLLQPAAGGVPLSVYEAAAAGEVSLLGGSSAGGITTVSLAVKEDGVFDHLASRAAAEQLVVLPSRTSPGVVLVGGRTLLAPTAADGQVWLSGGGSAVSSDGSLIWVPVDGADGVIASGGQRLGVADAGYLAALADRINADVAGLQRVVLKDLAGEKRPLLRLEAGRFYVLVRRATSAGAVAASELSRPALVEQEASSRAALQLQVGSGSELTLGLSTGVVVVPGELGSRTPVELTLSGADGQQFALVRVDDLAGGLDGDGDGVVESRPGDATYLKTLAARLQQVGDRVVLSATRSQQRLELDAGAIYVAMRFNGISAQAWSQLKDPQLPSGGGAAQVLKPQTMLAIDLDANQSRTPSGEGADKAFDGDVGTKYLNFGKEKAGLEFSYGMPVQLKSLVITTANDAPERDPKSYQLYGAAGGEWKLLSSGDLALPAERKTASAAVTLSPAGFYSQYRLVFPTMKNASAANSLQLAEVQFTGVMPVVDLPLAAYGAANVTPGLRRVDEWRFSDATAELQIAYAQGLASVQAGPVINGDVLFDLRGYDDQGALVSNLNLIAGDDESATRTDSQGQFAFADGLGDASVVGNRDGVLDWKDGLLIAGTPTADGRISLVDSISGVDFGFPLVGLPDGDNNLTILTTLKYAALLRWRPEMELLGQELTPELISHYYGDLLVGAPASLQDDSFSPYAALQSADAGERQEGVDTLVFSYQNLAVVKTIIELFEYLGLDFGENEATREAALQLWGYEPQPENADRAEIAAFSAYGYALTQRFGASGEVNPTDRFGRMAVGQQFDVRDADHLRVVLKEIVGTYPLERVLADLTESQEQAGVGSERLAELEAVSAALKDQRSAAEASLVDGYVEAVYGEMLDRLSAGLSRIVQTVESRLRESAAVGEEFVIPSIAGSKRFMVEELASELVRLSVDGEYADVASFEAEYLATFFTPLLVDARDRVSDFKVSLSGAVDERSALVMAPVVVTPGDGEPEGAGVRLQVLLQTGDGLEQGAPDYGLSVRFRVGGSAIEGVDYELDGSLSDRTLVVPAGASGVELPIRLLQPAGGHGGRVLDVQLLSSDSGYGVASEESVVHVVLPGGVEPEADSALRSGAASSFREHAVVREANGAGVLRAPVGAGGNVVLEGVDGRKDLFLLGRVRAGEGLVQVRNFDPGDGDQVLIDPGAYGGGDIEDFNTYAGLVMHLASGEALALIGDVGAGGEDLAWSGLSSSPLAGYYRYATEAELQLPVMVEPEVGPPVVAPVLPERPVMEEPIAAPEEDAGGVEEEERRGVEVPAFVQAVGRSEVVVAAVGEELEVRGGEMGLGREGRDVLRAVVLEGEEEKPVLLSGGDGSDVYGVAAGGMTVIADGGGGKRDVVTGLAGSVESWSWRKVGGAGDVLLVGGEEGSRTRVLLVDPLGEGEKQNRIERVEVGGERYGMRELLGVVEERVRVRYGELNERRGGVLGEGLGLDGAGGREELVAVVSENLQGLAGV
jgi:hypothetical protein